MLYKSTIYGDDLSGALPYEAYRKGWRLYEQSFVPTIDPVQLRDRNKEIISEWHYVPSLTEVFEVCSMLLEQRSEAER